MSLRNRRLKKLTSALLSIGVHVFVVIPYGIARLLPDPSNAPLEVVMLLPEVDAPDSPSESEPTQEAPLLAAAPQKQEPPKEEEPEDPAKRKPEDKKEEKKEEKPPLMVLPNVHLKMVNQEHFPDEADNPDANYLAQKNHRAEKETRATDTNLVTQLSGEAPATSENNNKSEQVGEKDRVLAELQDHQGPKDRLPVQNDKRGEHPDAEKEQEKQAAALLAMRSLPPEKTEPSKDVRSEGLERPEPGIGELPLARTGDGEGPQARTPAPGTPGRYSLTYDDYDRIVGHDVAAKERRDALTRKSTGQGRWERVQQKMALMRSALENFTPAVRPGNQSELGTRKHPFAAFIASMHNQIHRFWGHGYLTELDGRSSADPYNDFSLVTSVEIILRSDGSLLRIMVHKHSGLLPFDTAALDAVMSAAPFPEPPEAIKSKDGNVYLTWFFHRDGRQCATDFVDPHILITPPKIPEGQQLPRAPMAKGKPAPIVPTLPMEGPFEKPRPPKKGGTKEQEDPPVTKPEERNTVPALAQEIAKKWLAAYEKGDVRWLAGSSALPFTAAGKTVAEDAETLKEMYREMLAENGERKGTLSFYDRAQLKRKLGKIPAGGDEDDMVFAWVQSGREDFYLVLQQADRGWRVVGISR